MITKKNLKQTGEWYLYHHWSNENALLPIIVISFLTFFLHNGWLISLIIWIGYAVYCVNNDLELDKNPDILRKRAWWTEEHKRLGEWEKCKEVLGIQ